MNDPSAIERGHQADLTAAVRSLSITRADDYESWIKAAGGTPALFEEFSRRSTKYQEGEPAKKWESFNGDGVTARSIFLWAKEDGYRPIRNGKARQPAKPHEQPQENGDPCAGIEPIDATDLIDQYKEMRSPVIEGVLRQREIMAFVSASKHGKTFLMMLMALCLATGRMFLGQFPVVRCKVLILDLELHPETLARRLAAVAKELGITSAEYAGWLKIIPMRGRLKTLEKMDALIRRQEGFGVIIIDSLYRAWPDGLDENSNSDVTKVFNRLDSWTDATGASIVAVHHASKGSQSGKSVVDVGSGAGAMARAVDTHLILRAHEEEDCAVMEGVARSWPPLSPLGLRWAYPLWRVDAGLDVNKLREPGARGTAGKVWTAATFAEAVLNGSAKPKTLIIAAAKTHGITFRDAETWFAQAQVDGLIEVQIDPDDSRKKVYVKRGARNAK